MSHLVLCLAVPSGKTNGRPPNPCSLWRMLCGDLCPDLPSCALPDFGSCPHAQLCGDSLLWQAALQSALVLRTCRHPGCLSLGC